MCIPVCTHMEARRGCWVSFYHFPSVRLNSGLVFCPLGWKPLRPSDSLVPAPLDACSMLQLWGLSSMYFQPLSHSSSPSVLIELFWIVFDIVQMCCQMSVFVSLCIWSRPIFTSEHRYGLRETLLTSVCFTVGPPFYSWEEPHPPTCTPLTPSSTFTTHQQPVHSATRCFRINVVLVNGV